MHHGPILHGTTASRSDHSVEGQDGNPATPEWYHLPDQGPGTNGEEAKYGDEFVDEY